MDCSLNWSRSRGPESRVWFFWGFHVVVSSSSCRVVVFPCDDEQKGTKNFIRNFSLNKLLLKTVRCSVFGYCSTAWCFIFQDFLVSSPGQRILKHTDILWRLVKQTVPFWKRPMNSLKMKVSALGDKLPSLCQQNQVMCVGENCKGGYLRTRTCIFYLNNVVD